jgi:hypothetical protein
LTIFPRLLAATAAAILAAAVSASAGARLDVSNEHIVFVCTSGDSMLGHIHTPNCSGYGERAGRRVLMSYNDLGLRDKDYPARPAPGVVRLLAAGGSVLTGSGLEEKDSPPRALERSLRRLGLKAEVIDASGEGYTGWQNAVLLPQYLDAYSPRAVVYYFPSHYIFTDRSNWPRMRVTSGRLEGLEPRLAFLRVIPPSWRKPLARWLKSKTILLVYREQWDRIRTSWRLALTSDPERRFDDLARPTLRILHQMDSDCRARGIEFFVAYGAEELNADYYVLPHRPPLVVRLEQALLVRQFRFDGARFEKRMSAEGLKVLPLDAAQAALESPENRLPGDYHWNEKGAALFGDVVAAQLVQSLNAAAPLSRRP